MSCSVVEPAEAERPPSFRLPLQRDREFSIVLAVFTAVYLVAIYFAGQRFVWFDELCTFDIARAASLHQLWDWLIRFDNNPPTVYLLSRFSMLVLGPTPLGLRLPSMVEFYLASVCMLIYLRRKSGTGVAAFAVAILWSSASFYYATEARVYALVFLTFMCLLLSWDTATKKEERTAALWCVAISTFFLLLSHVFASLCLWAFLVAEFARYLRRRKPDYPLYAALVLPMAAMALYIPLVRVYGGLILWPQFNASPKMIGLFYYHALDPIARALFLVTLFALILLPLFKSKESFKARFSREDWILFVCILFNPVLLNLVLMPRKGDFFDRYTLTADVVVYGLLAVLFAVRMRFTRITAYAASLVMLLLMAHSVERNYQRKPQRLNPNILRSLRPDLPIVVSNGATWVEMNQHESPEVVKRLYYIKNRAAALKYDGTNYYYDFEALDDMKRAGFPFDGNVEPYSDFLSGHREFLIYADPSEWLPVQLEQDGAKFTLLLELANSGPNSPDAIPKAAANNALEITAEGKPHIYYPTPYRADGSPYIATHVFLVEMPEKY